MSEQLQPTTDGDIAARMRFRERHPNDRFIPNDFQRRQVSTLRWDVESVASLLAAKDHWQVRAEKAEAAAYTDTFSEDLGFNPYGEREQLAMGWTLQLVGKMLGAKGWAQGDGSETVEGDCAHEVQNIMTSAGLVTADGDMLTADLFRANRDDLIEQCALAAEAQDRAGREWVADSLWANILKRAGDNVRALKAVQP